MHSGSIHISQFAQQIVFLLVINALIKPFYIFGIDVGVNNAVGPEEYGLYWTLFSFVYIFSIFSDLGLQQFNNRFISQNPKLLSKYFPNIVAVKITLSVLFVLLASGVGVIFGYLQDHPLLFIALMVNALLDSFLLYLRSSISGIALYTQDSLISGVDKLCMIFICGYFLYFHYDSVTIYHFVFAQSISFLIAIMGCFYVLHGVLHRIITFGNRVMRRALLKQSLPYAFVIFLMLLYMRIDSVMIERLHENGIYEAGVYASEYRMLDTVNMVGFLFASLLLPIYSRNLSRNESIVPFAQLGLQLLMLIGIILVSIVIPHAGIISSYIYTASTTEWGVVLTILILTFIPRALDYIYGTMLVASGRLKVLNHLYIWASIGNIVLNIFTISRWGAIGAAVTTLICQCSVAIFLIWYSHRNILFVSIASLWRKILNLSLFMFCYGIFIEILVKKYFILPEVWYMFFSTIVAICSAFFLGVIDLKRFIQLLKTRKGL